MPGLLLLRGEQGPPAEPALRDAEILDDPQALLDRLREGPGRPRWVALADDLEDPAGLAQRIRATDSSVGILLLPRAGSAGADLPLEPGRDDVAAIAHEMGTPLNAILGYAELLEESAGDDKGRKRASTIVDQVHRLSALVEKLLERG